MHYNPPQGPGQFGAVRGMNIEEFQAKKLLSAYGIRVPQGEAASTADEARDAGERLEGSRWMVKAQICAGGRGRGAFVHSDSPVANTPTAADESGIRTARDLDQLRAHAADMLGKSLVTAQTGAEGLPVRRVYVEQALDSAREVALAMRVDERSRRLVLLLFEHGGGDIEDAAAAKPDSVHRISVTLAGGVDADRLRAATAKLGLDESMQNELGEVIAKTAQLFRDKDARLIEINPLAACAGHWFALDAKMAFDNNALFRQQDIRELENARTPGHRLASLDGFNYIPLDGDVACLSVGAGLSMATLDAVRQVGGRPANFLDLPPDSKVNRVVGALEALLANPRAGSLLVNVFGGGIMRCDTISDAILLINHGTPITLPLTVRLAGTNAELANRRLKESIPGVFLAGNLAEAAESAVAAAAPVGTRPRPSRMAKWRAALGRKIRGH